MKTIRQQQFHLRTFTIRGLLAAVTLVAIVLAVRHYLDPVNQYRRNGSQSSLVDAIRGRLHDGMDRERVIQLFGDPVDVSSDEVAKRAQVGYIGMVRKVAPLNAMAFPDGILDEDEFLSFRCIHHSGEDGVETLHFRDEKLINFSSQWIHDDDVMDALQ